MSERRVRHIVKGLGPGGAERLIAGHVTSDRSGTTHDVVHLLAHKNHLVAELEAAGIEVTCLDARRGTRLGWVTRLRRLLHTDPTTIVHVHSPAVAAVTRLVVQTLPRRSRPRLIGTEHNRWPRHHRLTRLANRLTIRLETATIAVSDDVLSTIRGASRGQARTVVHGINLAAVRAAADRESVREELGAQEDDVVVVCVANLRREKALHMLVEAAGLALAEEPHLRYVLVGQGPLADDLDRWVEAADIEERFHVLGYRDDAPRVVSGADLLTLSSRHEGLPVAIMEALALGVPIAATDAGGTADAVGGAGILSPIDDPTALAASHVELARDTATRAAYAKQAEMEAERFSIERAIEEINEIYAEAEGAATAS